MHQTITIVTLPKKLLFKIPQNNYILRKKKALNNGGCCYRHNYKICPSTQSVPYIGYTYFESLGRVKQDIGRYYLQWAKLG